MSVSRIDELPARPRTSAEAVEVLFGLCHAFGSADTLEECVESTIRWGRLTLGDDSNAIRVFVPGITGRTLQFAGGDPDNHEPSSLQARNRAQCFQKKLQMRSVPLDSSDHMIFDLPLVSRGHSLGVFEVECSREVFESQRRILDAVVSQAAIVFRNLRFRGDLVERIEALQKSIEQLVDDETSKSKQLELGLAWTAHEFRGRLASVQMVLDHLLDTIADDGLGSRELMQRSHDQVQYVGGLTNQLLTGMVTRESLQRQDTDLTEILRSAIDECSWELNQNRVLYTGPERLLLSAGADHLRSAVGNVIRNALLYSPQDTTVEVELRSLEGSAVVGVHDRGPGVPADRREAIFRPFTRDGSSAPDAEGVGIGLFVTKQVVEAHGGNVRVTAGRGGHGASFIIELPHDPPNSYHSDRHKETG